MLDTVIVYVSPTSPGEKSPTWVLVIVKSGTPTTKELLLAVWPRPSATVKTAAGSAAPTVTLPVHVPEANVTDVGVIGSVPLWPAPVSAAVPL